MQTFEREKMMELLSHTDRSRSMSVATDTSIASILSNSDRLIPDAFMPVDIQVVSQRRVRPTSSRLMSQSGHASSGLMSSKGAATSGGSNSHYYNNSAHANAAFLRYMTSSTSATTSESVPFSSSNNAYASNVYASKRKNFIESGGDSAVHPEDYDALSRSRRSSNHSHLSTRDFVRGYA